jgi:hypothetical protein
MLYILLDSLTLVEDGVATRSTRHWINTKYRYMCRASQCFYEQFCVTAHDSLAVGRKEVVQSLHPTMPRTRVGPSHWLGDRVNALVNHRH